jgi:cobalt-zinc-cadmium efflux system outer membrane protein
MTTRIVLSVLIAALIAGVPALAQAPAGAPLAERYVDSVDGLTVDQAIARALEQEPSLRAARTEIEVAQGTQLQASVGPNPTVSFEHRVEPSGTDNLTTIAVEWPLNLFRKDKRVAAADREVTAVQLAVADRERILAAEVRMRYGDVLAAIRDSAFFDELVATTERQHRLLRSRVEEGATPPLERDLLDVDLRRLESDRLLQAGRTEAAVFELKRLLGLEPEAPLRVRDTLEALVGRELSASPPPGDTTLVDQRADVREAAARVDVAEARIEQSRSEGRFDVILFGNYMRMDAGFSQLGFGPNGGLERVRGLFHYVSAGASISVPLLNRNQGDVAAATAGRAGAAAALDAVRWAARSELAVARARDDRAQQAVKVYSGGAQALARQNLAVVSQSYDLGRVTVFDVLTEQRRYLEVERAYTEALKAAYEARTALRLALGGVQ